MSREDTGKTGGRGMEEIGKRREWSRQHRWAQRKGDPQSPIDRLWEGYEEQGKDTGGNKKLNN